MPWEDILADPEFQAQPSKIKAQVAGNYFKRNIADAEFLRQPPGVQAEVKKNFFGTLQVDTSPDIWNDQLKPTLLETGKQIFEIPKTIGDVALGFGGGALGWGIGGIAGIAEATKPGATRESVQQARENIESRLSFEPRTQPGQVLMEKAGRLMGAVTGPAAEASALVGESWDSPFLEAVLKFAGEAATFEAMGKATKIRPNIKAPEWYRRMTIPERGLVEGIKADLSSGQFTADQIRQMWKDPANRAELLKRYQGVGRPAPEQAGTFAPEKAPTMEGRLSNPIIADALLKAAREKALPGPEGMDMNIGQDFTVTPSRALADMIIRSRRGRLPAGQTPMLPEPPASSPVAPEIALLAALTRKHPALPPGQGFELVSPEEYLKAQAAEVGQKKAAADTILQQLATGEAWLSRNAWMKGTPMFEKNAKAAQELRAQLAGMGIEPPPPPTVPVGANRTPARVSPADLNLGDAGARSTPVPPVPAKKGAGANNIIGRIQELGGINAKADYSPKYLRQYPDLRRVLNAKTGLNPDDIAATLKAEGYPVESGDALIEALKDGRGREMFAPEKADELIERKLRREENDWIEARLADLEAQEGIDAGTEGEGLSDLRGRLSDKIKAEGLVDEEAALRELDDFFSSVREPGKRYETGAEGKLFEKRAPYATLPPVTPKKGTGENIPPETTQSPRGGIIPEESVVRDIAGNPIPVYHGSSNTFDKLTAENSLGVDNLVGYGIYTTESPMEAAGYTKKGTGTAPSLRQVYLDIRNPLDFDKAPDASFREEFMDRAIGEGWNIDDGLYQKAISKDYSDVWTFLEEFGLYKEEMADESLTQIIENMGYDGITHIGGTEKAPHRVWVAFNDDQVIYPHKEIIPKEVYEKYPDLLPNPTRPPEGGGLDNTESGVRIEARRAGYDEKQLDIDLEGYGRGVSSARGKMAAGGGVGATVRASGIPADFKRSGFVSLAGAKVEGPGDLAAVAQIFRDPRIETLRIFYVKDGKIVAHEGLSSRMPHFSQFYAPKDIPKEVTKIIRRMRRVGANQIYLLHNHPTGNPKASAQDVAFTDFLDRNLSNYAKKMGVEASVEAHVIIDHKEYTVVRPSGKPETFLLDEASEKWKAGVPHDLLGTPIDGAEDVIRIARDLKTPRKFATLIFRTADGTLGGIQDVPLGIVNGKDVAGYVRNRAVEFGSAEAVLVLRSMKDMDWRNMRSLIEGGVFQDIVAPSGEGVRSNVVKPADDAAFGLKTSDTRYDPQRVAEETKPYAAKGSDIYARNREIQTKGAAKTVREEMREVTDDIKLLADEYLGAISTRLENIHPQLRAQMRKMEMTAGIEASKAIRRVEPMLQKIKGMTKEDRMDFDLARKNGDASKLKELIDKYKMWPEYTNGTRAVLNELHEKAKAAGFDVGYLKHFHPRVIKDPKGFLAYFRNQADWPVLEMAIRAKETELGRYLEIDEKAALINKLLRGYRSGQISLSKPGQLKSREIGTVTPELNRYYMDSDAALLRYISTVTDAIEMRKAFGVTKKGAASPQDTIGHYILGLLERGIIRPEDEPVLRSIYNARFNEQGTRGVIGLYKNLSYIDTMGSPISAITQIGDLAWALYKNGIIPTTRAAGKATAGKSAITKEDIGIDMIAKEFADTSKASRAVRHIFDWIGLSKIDNIGKESLINSTINEARKRAINPKKVAELRKELQPIFEGETDSLIKDLAEGKITENVKLYAFNTLSDFQPISLSEMPQKYLTGGNGRIFYMLKSFTLKQFDVYRREVFRNIAKEGTRLKGLKNLLFLSAAFIAANASADVIKALILNRDIDPGDLTVDNLARLAGISKYTVWKARTEGTGSALVRTIAPPFKLADSLTKDIARAGDGKGLETPQSIPVVGKLYYWWFGKGADKEARRAERQRNNPAWSILGPTPEQDLSDRVRRTRRRPTRRRRAD